MLYVALSAHTPSTVTTSCLGRWWSDRVPFVGQTNQNTIQMTDDREQETKDTRLGSEALVQYSGT